MRAQMSKLYYWALNRGIVVRWTLYILPVLALLWIPGIVGLTGAKKATVWDVKLVRPVLEEPYLRTVVVVNLAVRGVGRFLGGDGGVLDRAEHLAQYDRGHHPEREEIYRRGPRSWPVGLARF